MKTFLMSRFLLAFSTNIWKLMTVNNKHIELLLERTTLQFRRTPKFINWLKIETDRFHLDIEEGANISSDNEEV